MTSPVEKAWCAVKHGLSAEVHLQESLANKSREMSGGSAGLTSRGPVEELWQAVGQLVNKEEHLEEMMSLTRDEQELKELARILDETRKNRQRLVKMALDAERRLVGVSQPVPPRAPVACDRCVSDLALPAPPEVEVLSEDERKVPGLVECVFRGTPISECRRIHLAGR